MSDAGTVVLALTPPTSIGGWQISYTQSLRKYGDPLLTKSLASGFLGVSGMSITSSGDGVMSISFSPQEVSGLNPGAYYYSVQRTNSGFNTTLVEGYRLM